MTTHPSLLRPTPSPSYFFTRPYETLLRDGRNLQYSDVVQKVANKVDICSYMYMASKQKLYNSIKNGHDLNFWSSLALLALHAILSNVLWLLFYFISRYTLRDSRWTNILCSSLAPKLSGWSLSQPRLILILSYGLLAASDGNISTARQFSCVF